MLSIQALISAERKNKIQKSKKSSGAFLGSIINVGGNK
jgi:hypothetical protein